jgi:hypothetical protein
VRSGSGCICIDDPSLQNSQAESFAQGCVRTQGSIGPASCAISGLRLFDGLTAQKSQAGIFVCGCLSHQRSTRPKSFGITQRSHLVSSNDQASDGLKRDYTVFASAEEVFELAVSTCCRYARQYGRRRSRWRRAEAIRHPSHLPFASRNSEIARLHQLVILHCRRKVSSGVSQEL